MGSKLLDMINVRGIMKKGEPSMTVFTSHIPGALDTILDDRNTDQMFGAKD